MNNYYMCILNVLSVFVGIVVTMFCVIVVDERKRRKVAKSETGKPVESQQTKVVYQMVFLLKDLKENTFSFDTLEELDAALVKNRNALIVPNGIIAFTNAVYRAEIIGAIYGRATRESKP